MEPKFKKMLYHYTSSETALEILSNRQIWASDVRMSNDRLEGEYFNSEIERTFLNLAERETDPKLSSVMTKVSGLYRLYGSTACCLAFCLSEDGDLLSQWNAYADDSKGICIGFHHEDLDWDMVTGNFLSASGFGTPVFEVSRVEYGKKRLKQKVRREYRRARKIALRFLDEMFEAMIDWRREYHVLKDAAYAPPAIQGEGRWPRGKKPPSMIDGLPNGLKNRFYRDAGFFGLKRKMAFDIFYHKHPGFRQEREWRFETTFAEGFAFVDRILCDGKTKLIIKHSLLDFPKCPIRSVILGPLCELSIADVEALLQAKGYNGVLVGRSEIPLQ